MIQVDSQPIPITGPQYQAKFGVPPPVTNTPTLQTEQQTQPPIQITAQQYTAKYGTPPPTSASSYEVAMGQKNPDGTPNTTPGIIPNTVNQVGKDLAANAPGNPLQKGVQATADVFGAVGQLPVLKQIGEVFGKGISMAGEQLSKLYTPEFQKSLATLSPEDYTKATQPLKDLQNLGTIANTILMAKGAEKGSEVAPGVIDNAKNTINAGADVVKNKVSDLNPLKEQPMTPEALQTELKGVADDWKSPTDINKVSYDKARFVLSQDPEVTTNLAKNGFNPYTHIEDGSYITKDAAEQIRTETGKLSADALRPSLQIDDYSIPKTPVAGLQPKASTFNFTVDDEPSIQKAIANKLQALDDKYPEGMSLTNMLDEKIKFDKNGGYKEYKPKSDNIDAVANRAVADELRKQLDTKTPDSTPIKEFNAELAKRYRMADYLEALNGKKAPVSLTQTILRLGAKFGGAKLGSVFGGNVVSAFGGYQIGKMVESFAENLSNPARDTFLRNMKITNPEAFNTISKKLSDFELQKATQLKLPPASPETTNAIPLGSKTSVPTPAEVIPANKYPTSVNPKSGKFQKVYKSQ